MIRLARDLILGSKSPRRRELLALLGIPFRVEEINIEESFPEDHDMDKIADLLSSRKSRSFRTLNSGELLITADTVVICNNEIYGKAANRERAIEMINSLTAKEHKVITSVSLRTENEMETFSVSTKVYFGNIKMKDIEYYVDTYEPYDKAGAYGIQEWIGMIGIEKIEGDYFNVVGLPVFELYKRLQKFSTD